MQNLRNILFCGLLTLITLAYSNTAVDSLSIALGIAKTPEEKLILLNRLFSETFPGDKIKAINYADRALRISDFCRNESEKAIALYNKGIYLLGSNMANDAGTYFNNALRIFNKNKNSIWVAKTTMQLGLIAKKNLKYEKALELFFKAKEVFEEQAPMSYNMASILTHIGGVYYDQKEYGKAYEYWEKCQNIREAINDSAGLLSTYNNIGEIYRLSNDFDKALGYYNEVIAINKTLNRYSYLPVVYDNIGNIYLSEKNYDSALLYLSKSLNAAIKENDELKQASAHKSLGNLYIALSEYDRAKVHFLKAKDIGTKLSNIYILKDVTLGLGKTNEKLKKYEDAYKYFNEYKRLTDSISQINNFEDVTKLEMRLMFENEKELSKIEHEKREWIYFIIAIGLLLLIIIIAWLYGRQKIRIQHSQTAKENLKLERKRLHEELDFKNRELATNVMYMVKKNELINHISEKLLKAKIHFKKENITVAEEVIHTLQMSADDRIWNTFEKRFEEVHENFYTKLDDEFPSLTAKDRKLCALLRLHLSTKEIATIMHQNTASVEVARTRLRKKLNLSNTDINLVTFLSTI